MSSVGELSGKGQWGPQQVYQFNAQTQNWVQIPGSLVQLRVGADAAVWGLDAANVIYRYQ